MSKRTSKTSKAPIEETLFASLTKDCPEAIVDFGEGPMVYLSEGVYAKADGGTYLDE